MANFTIIEHCLFCGNPSFKKFDEIADWKIVKCKKCGYVFTNPRPSEKDLPNYYTFDYYKDERHYKKFFNENGSLRNDSDDYMNRIRIIETYVSKRGALLEIGAAHGDFLYALKNRGWKTSGIEISEDAVKIAKEKNNIDLYTGTLESFESKNKFDVICMFQTLEHLPNPKFLIDKSFELLNPNGIIVIEVPNINSFDMKINFERKRLSYDLPRHLSHFSPSFLKKQMEIAGFSILKIDRYYPNFILNALKKRTYSKNTSSNTNNSSESFNQASILELLKDNTTWKGKMINKISLVFPGWKFSLIAKKKVNEIF